MPRLRRKKEVAKATFSYLKDYFVTEMNVTALALGLHPQYFPARHPECILKKQSEGKLDFIHLSHLHV